MDPDQRGECNGCGRHHDSTALIVSCTGTTASSATRHEITAEIQIEKSVPTSLRAGLPTIAAAQQQQKSPLRFKLALLVDIDPLMMSAVQTPNATIVAHAMN